MGRNRHSSRFQQIIDIDNQSVSHSGTRLYECELLRELPNHIACLDVNHFQDKRTGDVSYTTIPHFAGNYLRTKGNACRDQCSSLRDSLPVFRRLLISA